MAKKRPSAVDAETGKGLNDDPQEHQAKRLGRPERDKVSMTFFIPRPTHKKMKILAVERDTSLQQLLEEMVDFWLQKNGQGSFHKVDVPEEKEDADETQLPVSSENTKEPSVS